MPRRLSGGTCTSDPSVGRFVLLHIRHVLTPAQCRKRPRCPLCRGELHRPEVLRCHRSRQITFHGPDIGAKIGIVVVRNQHRLQQLDLLVLCPVHQVRQVLQAIQVGDDFEGVALVYQELLALGAVEHLLGIFRHQGVEERVEALVISALRTQDAP